MGEDSLRTVLDSVFAAPDYRWVERPTPLAFLTRWLEGLQRWLFTLREAHPLGFRVFLAALAILLVIIVVHAGWILFHTVRASGSAAQTQGDPVLRRDRAWYRREADRLAALGRYAEAVQADFLSLVLALESLQVLRFHPGKTPAEYSRDSRLAPAAGEEFRELVHTLYGYAFAGRACGVAEFESWRARSEPERYARAH